MRSKIEISFPRPVEITDDDLKIIDRVIDNILDRNVLPNERMWIAGRGSKPTFIPMTRHEEKTRGIEFDDSVEYFEVCSRQTDVSHTKQRCIREDIFSLANSWADRKDITVGECITSIKSFLLNRSKNPLSQK